MVSGFRPGGVGQVQVEQISVAELDWGLDSFGGSVVLVKPSSGEGPHRIHLSSLRVRFLLRPG